MDGDAGPQSAHPGSGDYAPSEFGREPAQQVSDDSDASGGLALSNANRAPAGLVYDNSQTPQNSQALSSPLPASGQTTLPPPGVREGSVSASSSPSTPRIAPFGDVSAQVSQRGVQEVAVIANDLGFFPKTLFVTRDVPVRLFVTGASSNTLCIMMDSFQVRKQIRARQIEEISFTPTTPGKYRFYCPVNGMEGSLVVKELSSEVPSSRSPASLVPLPENPVNPLSDSQ